MALKLGNRYSIAVLLCALLSGCQSHRVTYEAPVEIEIKDSGPATALAVDHIPDAVPVIEPRTKAGNKSPYTVNGKTYHLVKSSSGFTQQGYASWYGNKFHGRKTSNGEIYDMYGMTAAHKTLPIPSFVEVTNQENGKRVIVRVNDRGPFHGDRIIDLTYTAARKLGFAGKGTAPVTVRVVEPDGKHFYQGFANEPTGPIAQGWAPKPRNSGGYEIPPGTFLQLGAFGDLDRAEKFRRSVASLTAYPINFERVPERGVYRVLLGPLKDNWDLVHLQKHFVAKGFHEPQVVYR
ncbi:MAG TPA: septal ring lytic transglycosylase RlpA family protein [Marinagarivorans sp.]